MLKLAAACCCWHCYGLCITGFCDTPVSMGHASQHLLALHLQNIRCCCSVPMRRTRLLSMTLTLLQRSQ
jgi:hypothetical protein